MKLARYDDGHGTHLGVVDGNEIRTLDALSSDFPTMMALIEAGDAGLAKVRAHLATAPAAVSLDSVRLLAPVERPAKFLAIGMNYRKHAEEARRLGAAVPEMQFWFNKQTSCVSGPFDPIERGVSEQVDYEAELGVVIGKHAKGVSEADAASVIFGYLVVNDVSARDWQKHSPTFTMGKSFDTHGPIGPWIVTADEVPNPHDLELRCYVNGQERQSTNTGDLIHNIWQQIAYLTTAFTLEPGDILATGTPSGVGIARNPPVFLQSGDVVRCEVHGIGAIENKVA